MITIEPIHAFSDNYIWLLHNPDNKHAVVVDPGDAEPVIKTLQAKDLTLEAILITHKHPDHIGGVSELQNMTEATVYGPDKNIFNLADIELSEGDQIRIERTGVEFKVIELPGHTMEHIAYYNEEHLFCGDTLFVAGCGRVFEGTMAQMYHSLQKLAQLDSETKVYCAHEYTQANLNFALTVESDNENLRNFNDQVAKIRTNQQPTVPSSIKMEQIINPFLRCHEPEIQARVGKQFNRELTDPLETFAHLRKWKDNF